MIHLPEPAGDECTLLLLRHGATENNLADPPILQGSGINCGLSEHGCRQAEAASKLISAAAVSAVYASPLNRARETAEIVARPHALKVNATEEITEADVGEWEYRSWVNIAVEDPHEYEQFMTDPSLHGYLGGENLSQVLDRVLPAIRTMANRHLGETIVVVAHNVVNRVLLAHGLGLATREARTIAQDNCGINVIKFTNDSLKVKTLNSSFHLP